jgi:hypothetical protein
MTRLLPAPEVKAHLHLRQRAARIGFEVFFGVLWIAVAFGGAKFVAANPQSSIDFVATRPLVVNHRIVPGDVRAAPWPFGLTVGLRTGDDFIGRYVKHAVKPGAHIEFDATADAPSFSAALSIAWIPLQDVQRPDIARLDIGDLVEVCHLAPVEANAHGVNMTGASGACGAIAVEAVVCGTPAAPTNCWVAIRLTDDRRRRFALLAAQGTTAKIVSILTHDKGIPRCQPLTLSPSSSNAGRSRPSPRTAVSGPSSAPTSTVPHC